jgi:hypothetical protein
VTWANEIREWHNAVTLEAATDQAIAERQAAEWRQAQAAALAKYRQPCQYCGATRGWRHPTEYDSNLPQQHNLICIYCCDRANIFSGADDYPKTRATCFLAGVEYREELRSQGGRAPDAYTPKQPIPRLLGLADRVGFRWYHETRAAKPSPTP